MLWHSSGWWLVFRFCSYLSVRRRMELNGYFDEDLTDDVSSGIDLYT